jgi:redox-sensitive bicupin YhaK (pirin superfamily)
MAIRTPTKYDVREANGFRWCHVPERDVSVFRNDWLTQRQVIGFGSDITNIGAVVYLGHDDIRPGGVFPLHPHAGIQVLSYILAGDIAHTDTTGVRKRLAQGQLGYMMAGRGVRHSEENPGPDPLSLFQMFVLLDDAHREAAPSYVHFDPDAVPRDTIGDVEALYLAGERGAVQPTIPTEVTRLRFEPGGRLTGQLKGGREYLLYADQGRLEATVGDVPLVLDARDELVLDVDHTTRFAVTAPSGATAIAVASDRLA